MEQILNKLSEIELTAQRIMEDSERLRQELSAEMEKKCKDFDHQLETETSGKIRQLRDGLEQEKDAQLSALRADTDATFSALDAYYEENHTRLSQELFHKILNL